MTIRQLPQQDERVETGPVQFGDDWPGVFIRGDNAGYYAMHLKTLIEGGHDAATEEFIKMLLRGLQELLASAIVGPAREMVALAPEQVERP
jgi:hypothetical protein